jgi:salicylate hydroxylase
VSVDDAVAAFSDFSPDLKRLLSYSDKVGLWQLRDQDPLPTWVKGKAIIIADAAHAMLPHQGQGGGQSVEDAEACGVFLSGFTHADADKVPERLALIQKVRMERATKVQGYSREKAIGPREGETGGAINAHEFIGYNMGYNGALDWAKKIGVELPSDLSVPEATTTTTSQVTENVAGLELNGNGAAAASTAAAAASTEVPSESTAAVPSLAAIAA